MSKYSTLYYPEVRKFKKLLKTYSDKSLSFDQNFERILMTLHPDYIEKLKNENWEIYVKVVYSIIEKGFQDHFYLEDELLSEFVLNNPLKLNNIEDIIKGNEYIKGQNAFSAIHSKVFDRSLYFFYYKDSKKFIIGDGIHSMGILPNDNYVFNRFIKEGNSENLTFIKPIFNTLLYMTSFPDKVSNRPPDEIKHSNKEQGKTLKLNEQIKHYMESTEKTPHLRSGHFRYLESDFYKNKKGQTIFISPTFVKGNAKTIKE